MVMARWPRPISEPASSLPASIAASTRAASKRAQARTALGLRKSTPLDLARRWAQAPGEDALLRVQPVFRLVEHHRLRPVHDLTGDLLAAVRRQAMHEQCIRLGFRHQPDIDLVALEQIVTAA